jgi:predicted dehydrogenase
LFQKDAYIALDFAKREIVLIRRSRDRAAALVPGMDIQQLSFSEGDALENELAAFVQAVRDRGEPVVSGHTGRRALAVALTITGQIDAAIRRYLH